MSLLRKAVIWCSGTDTSWTAEEVARMADCSPSTAATYLGRLVSENVLSVSKNGLYRSGPKAAEWRQRPSKTHEGGNSARYLAAKAVRDEIRAREWDEKRKPGRLTGQGGTDGDMMGHTEPGGDNMAAQDDLATLTELSGAMTAAEVCAMLQCSEKTIKRWIATKRLRAIKINGMVRIPASAIAEIAREA